MFHWKEHLEIMSCPHGHVKLLNAVLLNISSYFIPNKVKTIRPSRAPWASQDVKNFLRQKNRAYKNFVREGQPDGKIEEMKNMTSKNVRK